jgi:hypothetical protein
MNKFVVFISIVIISIFIYTAIHAFLRNSNRSTLYKLAQKRSQKTKRKLIVIGDPNNGKYSRLMGAAYGCGDICIDLSGCPKCKNGKIGDATEELRKIPSNSAVIFISCVLEYVDNIEELITEIYRVGGNDSQNIFVVSVSQYDLFSYFYVDGNHKSTNIITHAPPNYPFIKYIPNFI